MRKRVTLAAAEWNDDLLSAACKEMQSHTASLQSDIDLYRQAFSTYVARLRLDDANFKTVAEAASAFNVSTNDLGWLTQAKTDQRQRRHAAFLATVPERFASA